MSQEPMDQPGLAEPLSPGTTVGGYAVERLLGRGAFGITYLARDTTLDTLVAVKEYVPQGIVHRDDHGAIRPVAPDRDAEFQAGRAAFLEEARTIARFKHPHIVRILSFFEANNTACFAMEYERGQSLKAWLKRRGTLTAAEVSALLDPVLSGLETLHAQEIIHRDIKPGNIYLRRNGEPVLLDFGAACCRMAAPDLVAPVATEGYAPPEQYREDLAGQGPWTDCYALAAVALRCLTGVLPPDALARQSALAAGQEDPLEPLLAVAAAMAPTSLLAVIRQGLALDPEQRVRSVRDWRQLRDRVRAQESADRQEGQTAEASMRNMLVVSGLLEHAEEDAQLLRACQPVTVQTFRSGEEAAQRLAQGPLDGCVVDSLLDDMSGLELLRRLRVMAGVRQTPLCFAGSDLGREQQLEAVSAGACALLPRPTSVESMASALRSMEALRQCHSQEESLVAQARQAVHEGRPEPGLQLLATWQPLVSFPTPDPANGAPKGRGTPVVPALRGATLLLFSQGCKAMVQDRPEEAGLALAMSRKTAMLEAEARMTMAEASRLAGRVQDFAGAATLAHQAHQLVERMDMVASSLAEALTFDQHRPLPLNTAGVQLRRAGELAAAELAYALALGLSPYAPRVHYNLAKALAHGGRHRDAFDEICRALTLDPEFEEAESLYRKITGKAWRTASAGRRQPSPTGMYTPLLDV